MTYESVCRACAGDGVGDDMPLRLVQVLQHGTLTVTQDHKLPRLLSLGRGEPVKEQAGGRIYLRAPLVELVRTLDRLLADGYTISHEGFPEHILREAVACDGCHGTGQPNLSVLTMEMALSHPTRGAA